MTTYIRTNGWNNGGNFQDATKKHYTELYWYAIGVYKMQQRALSDPASWWFFGAMHAEYLIPPNNLPNYPGWQFIAAPPAVPTTPLPPASGSSPFSSAQYWDQCQHYGWYFAPWHRGYLAAIEARLRLDIVEAGGPKEWALPYWDYFGSGNEFKIPPAFTQAKLPSPPAGNHHIPHSLANPLLVTARYGPDGTGDIYVPTPAGVAAHPSDPNFIYGTVTDACMQTANFTTGGATGNGFGGDGNSLFTHFGGRTGDLENNPHNLVHSYVGGSQGMSGPEGLMSDPGLAALDPIFYLHHCNIDRMWAAWNKPPKGIHPPGPPPPTHPNPTQPPWTGGPTDRGFIMPMPKHGTPPTTTAHPYTPADVNSLGLAFTDYTYDVWPPLAAALSPADLLETRLKFLGAKTPAGPPKGTPKAVTEVKSELMAANTAPLTVAGSGARTIVTLPPDVREKFAASLRSASQAAPPDHVYLALEGVRGTRDSAVLSAYINLPDGADPHNYPNLLAGSVGLFGLRRASLRAGDHAGNGLSFTMNITKIVDELYVKQALNAAIYVAIVPSRELPQTADITIGRIAIYRRG